MLAPAFLIATSGIRTSPLPIAVAAAAVHEPRELIGGTTTNPGHFKNFSSFCRTQAVDISMSWNTTSGRASVRAQAR
jgi:hypothetical protein